MRSCLAAINRHVVGRSLVELGIGREEVLENLLSLGDEDFTLCLKGAWLL